MFNISELDLILKFKAVVISNIIAGSFRVSLVADLRGPGDLGTWWRERLTLSR